MKRTVVDHEGNVRCPKCGGKQFTSKRTGKAKIGSVGVGVLTFGVSGVVAAAAMPKRLRCQGCGENLKTGKAGDSEWAGDQGAVAASAPAAAAPAAVSPWQQVTTKDLRVGDRVKFSGRVGNITAIEPGRMKTVKIHLDDGERALTGMPGAAWDVKRPKE